MKEWFLKYWAEVLCGGIVTAITAAYRKRCKKQHALENGMAALLRHSLYQLYFECECQKFITVEQLELAKSLYEPYHDSGYNGIGTAFYNKMLNMPNREIAEIEEKKEG